MAGVEVCKQTYVRYGSPTPVPTNSTFYSVCIILRHMLVTLNPLSNNGNVKCDIDYQNERIYCISAAAYATATA